MTAINAELHRSLRLKLRQFRSVLREDRLSRHGIALHARNIYESLEHRLDLLCCIIVFNVLVATPR